METLTIAEALKKKARLHGISTENVYNIAEALSVIAANDYQEGEVIVMDMGELVIGKYVSNTGPSYSNKNSACTDFIPVFPYCEVTLTGLKLNAERSVCGYGYADDGRLSSSPTYFKTCFANNTEETTITFTVPENVFRIRATTANDGTITGRMIYHKKPVTP